MPIQIVIFDCDGVMFDTAGINRAYYNRVMTYMGRPEMTEEQFAYVHAHTGDESIAFLFEDERSFREAQAFRQTLDYMEFIPDMVMEPHLKPLIKTLRPRYKTAVVTNRTDTMPAIISEFDLKRDFDMVVTAWDVQNPKPDPEGLIKVLNHFRLSPEEAIYVGDTHVDEAASSAARVTFVAYANPGLNAAYHIHSLDEIRNIVR
ncbi:HAD-superfamily hydrolase, subfamily IA, variant 1 [Desulfococcus multivorans DSM 2059]|jgi:HAD superfamily hydrolase (TIGR01509 family)|uniref:phosphoglycolate phosphatase n=2 Tax=Desulfococcaceae TaxID=2931039 RepID=S7UZG3_DESML|nr:HAD-superfamily hydrolase, subfamily IA, variant 1 [Desulfococcus multivorans DSM 2059]SJZ91956.1 haloacid dehalogenase superfamily, subfamily IA, variant 3 with third motif having DD or ED/haloacid dehalogenase superfamily, subfamily IA, variant 1 with third motif having Dx(3-4)D or Dx(3-4)E [Desulfococcus multivorans DSM 2059]